MSTDTVFRNKLEPVKETPEPTAQELTTGGDVEVEVPYLDYRNQHSRPYIADAFNLGNYWDDPVGGYPEEVAAIDDYIKEKIVDGEIGNSIDDVKAFIKTMEKTNNLTHESRAVVKLEILSNYIEFMKKNDNLKSKLRRYGNAYA